MAKRSTFRLPFHPDEIDELRRRYDYATDHEVAAAGRHARERGYYTKPGSSPSAGGNHREAPDELRTTLPARSTGRPGSPSARTMRSSECKR
jgi:hypothetical protein